MGSLNAIWGLAMYGLILYGAPPSSSSAPIPEGEGTFATYPTTTTTSTGNVRGSLRATDPIEEN